MKSGTVLVLWAVAASALGCSEPLGPGAAERKQGGPVLPGELDDLTERYPIVFSSTRNGVGNLYVMSADGTSWRQLTPRENFYWPRWAPDGKKVVFRHGQEQVNANVGVAVVGGELSLLTDDESWQDVVLPANWLPDGSAIAFASRGGGVAADLRLWTIPTTGGERERLVPDETQQGEVAWSSPDGASFAYTQGPSVARDVWLTSTASPEERTNLTLGRVATPHGLVFSPDGSRLAFAAFALGPDGMLEGGHATGGPDPELFVLDLASGELVRLTENDAADEAPAWTPDGNGLLFTSDRDGDLDLFRLELDAPEDAWNLIDDDDDPQSDAYGHWYVGAP